MLRFISRVERDVFKTSPPQKAQTRQSVQREFYLFKNKKAEGNG